MASKSHSTDSREGNGTESEANFTYESPSASRSQVDAKGAVGSLDDALHTLERALVDNKQELQRRLMSDFRSLQNALSDFLPQMSQSMRKWSTHTVDSAREMGRQTYKQTQQMASQVDDHVHQSPWTYVGGAAIGSLILGYMLGRSGRDTET